ncbi:hypothetical protein LG943_00735 [Streptomonospora sp. S1-112]|uniref:Replication initiation protein n=1 Tax=Streptomonospora mangrovi TaxID=2883123 RepID=A0A9X3NJB8_9ACTN|nr:replication initiator [Streptomonospora mangrovi]MDA0562869.1 hypothetical protein [Streptomonospora mangrovi]
MGDAPGLAALLARVSAADYDAWRRQVVRAGHCVAPVRVRGHASAVDTATGEVQASFATADQPDGLLLLACGDRRAAVCPPCAAVYRRDMVHLVGSGLVGRGGEAAVPAEVADHPRVFMTLTAPSFGPVHRASAGPCRLPPGPRRRCRHGVPADCGLVHEADHPVVGTPLCAACYDYTTNVLWHLMAPELWRRTTIAVGRELARAASTRLGRRVSVTALRDVLRVSYVKIAEFQKRGAVHFHAILRLDGVDPADRSRIVAPPAWATSGLLREAVAGAVGRASVAMPSPDGRMRVAAWGRQVDIRDITGGDAKRLAGYLAKYTTKTASDAVGADAALARRLHVLHPTALRRQVGPHLAQMVATAWKLGGQPGLEALRRWAHQLGYRGHFATKSRVYAMTLGALREARRAWRRRERARSGTSDVWGSAGAVVVGDWAYAGRGYVGIADAAKVALMAEEADIARADIRHLKRVEKEMRFWGASPVLAAA